MQIASVAKRVLFIGNSLTFWNQGVDVMVKKLVPGIETSRVAVGGACDAAHCDDAKRLDDDWSDGRPLPERRDDVDFSQFSTVLGGRPGNEGSMTCGANSPLEFHEFKASYTDLPGRLKPRPVDARNASSSVESRTTLDAKPTLDDVVVDIRVTISARFLASKSQKF